MVLIQLSHPSFLFFRMTNPPEQPLFHQKISIFANLQMSPAGITSIFSVFNLFLNAPGKCAPSSTELTMPVDKVAAKVAKQGVYFHIFVKEINYI